MQRPILVAASACMTIAGSTTWLAALSLSWLVARYGRQEFNTANPGEAALYYVLQRFDDRMTAVWPPLVGFPLAAMVVAMILPGRNVGPRTAYTVLGLGAMGFVTWWWWDTWWVYVTPVTFIALALLMVQGVTGRRRDAHA
jgi:hypothetical protein